MAMSNRAVVFAIAMGFAPGVAAIGASALMAPQFKAPQLRGPAAGPAAMRSNPSYPQPASATTDACTPKSFSPNCSGREQTIVGRVAGIDYATGRIVIDTPDGRYLVNLDGKRPEPGTEFTLRAQISGYAKHAAAMIVELAPSNEDPIISAAVADCRAAAEDAGMTPTDIEPQALGTTGAMDIVLQVKARNTDAAFICGFEQGLLARTAHRAI
jgi:hypothetical protein